MKIISKGISWGTLLWCTMNVITVCYPFCHYNMDKSNIKYRESATTTTIAAVFNKSNVSPRESATTTTIAIVFNDKNSYCI